MVERQVTILIAEDTVDILDPLVDFLESIGYKCKKAMNGKEAWGIFEASQSEIDLVITDLDMPIMNGGELIRLIREKDPEKPIILMSARKSEDLIGLGATRILGKPMGSLDNLATMVIDLLSSRTIDKDTLARAHVVAGKLGQGIGSGRSPVRQKH